MVQDYRAARDAAILERESVTLGYATENNEYGHIITFKDYLIGMAR